MNLMASSSFSSASMEKTKTRTLFESAFPEQLKGRKNVISVLKCSRSDGGEGQEDEGNMMLQVGSPIVIIEAPKMLKTAASVPCLRLNAGSVKPGDVGRIISRKPKDTWAVRLSIGTYLIDSKYFKPLQADITDDP